MKPQTHPYAADLDEPPDHRGDRRCWCGLPARNERHVLPETPPEVLAEEARRLGEDLQEVP